MSWKPHFAERSRKGGASPLDAAREGAVSRLRAILMTAAAMIFAVNFGDLRMYVPDPGGSCYVETPNARSVYFAGKFINLSEISRITGLHISYLSRIFKRQRMPTVAAIIKICNALDIQVQEFLGPTPAELFFGDLPGHAVDDITLGV